MSLANAVCTDIRKPLDFTLPGNNDHPANNHNKISRARLMTRYEFLYLFRDMPSQTAALGVCDDSRPVLFDLAGHDAGSILIMGDYACGKTRLMQFMVETAITYNNPCEVKYLVISSKPEEWDKSWLNGSLEHCSGLIADYDSLADKMINRMASLVEQRSCGRQYGPAFLFVLDDLMSVENMDITSQASLEWLLHHGPEMQVYPIISLPAQQALRMDRWISHFPSRVNGWMSISSQEISGADLEMKAETLEPSRQFSIWSQNHWLRFWLPVGE